MDQAKSFYQSKGVIGSIVVLIGVIIQALGYTWGPDDQQVAVTLASTILEGIGGLLAMWGRVSATKQVKLKVPTPPPAAVVVLLCIGLILGASGCASKEEVLAYYDAQVKAHQAKATAEAQKRPLLLIEAKDGENVSLSGLKTLAVYAPTCDDGKGAQIAQHKDPAYSVGTTVLGIAAGVAGIYLSGQNMVDLANAVGQHAGKNVTVGGDYTRDGSTKYGGDVVGGDKAGRDGNWNSHNTTTTTTTSTSSDDHNTEATP